MMSFGAHYELLGTMTELVMVHARFRRLDAWMSNGRKSRVKVTNSQCFPCCRCKGGVKWDACEDRVKACLLIAG